MTSMLAATLFGSVISLATLYLVCFVFGFAITVLSFVVGSMHLHLPHFGPGGLGHAHGAMHAAAGHHDGGMHAAGHGGAQALPLLNLSTVLAFLIWFGATGYLLTHYSGAQVMIGFIGAVLGGLVGAAIVFWFLVKLTAYDRALDPADYELVGVIGRVNVTIRDGGTGEIVFSQAGTRRVAGARSDNGTPIAKGIEVVITRYERGLAYVKPWEEFTGDGEHNATPAGASGPG